MTTKLMSYFIDSHDAPRILLFSLFCLIISKGAALFDFGYSIDTYPLLITEGDTPYLIEISQGRIGGVFLLWIFDILGIKGAFAYILGAILGYIAIGLMAFLLCKPFLTFDHQDLSPSLLAIAIAICHPYLSEIFTFRGAALIHFSIALILGILGYLTIDNSIKKLIYGSILITIGLSIYQIFLNYLAITLLFSLLVSVRNNNEKERLHLISLDIKRLYGIMLGLALYFLILKISILISGVTNEGRSQFISLEDLPERLFIIKSTIIDIFYGSRFSGFYYHYWFSLLILFLFISLLKTQTLSVIFISSILLISAMFSVIGLLALTKVYWAVPRTLSAAAFFISGCVAYSIRFSPKLIRRILIISSIIASIGYAGISNKIFVDQQRLNERDRSLANRIIMRFEVLPKFNEIKRIVIIGSKWGYPWGFDTVQGDLNSSAFTAPWSKLNILREISGYNFNEPIGEDVKNAQEFCKDKAIWPAIEAVSQKGDLGIVCLEKIV